MACVYIHKRLDTDGIFYVGIANRKDRPYSKCNRNKHWLNIVNKTDYKVLIIVDNVTHQEACDIEKVLIWTYGRQDLGEGCLTNMTDGGEGTINFSEEVRIKISKSKLGKRHSDETKNKISLSLKGRKNNRIHKHSEETKIKISKRKNKKVILIETNKIYNSILDASIETGYHKSSIGRSCRNMRPTNGLNFRFYEGFK